jgi:hypothetical protein
MSTPTTSQLILGREPAFWTSFVMAIVAAVVAFGTPVGTETQGYIAAFVNAALAAVLATKVRPLSIAVFVGVVQTALPLLVALGLNLSSEQQGVLLTLAPIILNLLIVRPQVTPNSAPGSSDADRDYVIESYRSSPPTAN